MTARVAMIGSCVTRDIFKLPQFTQEDRARLFVLARTSLASLSTAPAGDFDAPQESPPGLSPFEIRMVGHDVRKTGLAALAAFGPTHLILDVVDDRFDLLRSDDKVATYSWELHQLGLHEGPLAGFRQVPRQSREATELWREGVERFGRFLAAELPATQVIIHDARCALEHVGEAAGPRQSFPAEWEFWPGRLTDIAGLNGLYDDYAAHLAAGLPNAALVRAPADLMLADSRHRWGLAPFHYVEDYYQSVWRELERLGCR